MSDSLLETQMAIMFSFPLQTLCFLVGGLLVFVGLGLAVIFPVGKWNARGVYVVGAGVMIAFPAVMPMVLSFIGGSPVLPGWFMNLSYIGIPLAGVLVGVWGWIGAGKAGVTLHETE